MAGIAKVAAGGAMGAYAFKQAQDAGPGSILQSLVKALPGFDSGASTSGRGGETQVLQGEVERLHKLLADAVRNKGGSHTVIHSGRGGGWAYVAVPIVVGGAVTYIYCRITGRSVIDMFFVTNRTLTDFKSSVTESIKVVWDEVKRQKDEVLARVGLLGKQQDKLSSQQDKLMESHADMRLEMDARLREVGEGVTDVRFATEDIKSDVNKLRTEQATKFDRMMDGMYQANNGIMMLCNAVASVGRHIGLEHISRDLEALPSVTIVSSNQAALPAPPIGVNSTGAATGSSNSSTASRMQPSASSSTSGLGMIIEELPSAGASTASRGAGGNGAPPAFGNSISERQISLPPLLEVTRSLQPGGQPPANAATTQRSASLLGWPMGTSFGRRVHS